MRNVILAALTLALLSACIGPAALPEATKEKVTPADLVGTWRYPADYGATTITLELKPNGDVCPDRPAQIGPRPNPRGHLDPGGSRPSLPVLKPVFGEPDKEWVVERASLVGCRQLTRRGEVRYLWRCR